MNIYWDIQGQTIVPSLNSRGTVPQYDFYLRDTLQVNLYLVTSQAVVNQPWAVTALAAGEEIDFGAKAAVTDTDFLFSQATWTSTGTGVTQRYVAEISLNTAELIAAMGDASSLDVIAEWTIRNTSNEGMYTTQVTFRILPDIITGSEGVPSSQYPVIAQYTDDSGIKAVRIVNAAGTAMSLFKNGVPYIFEPDTALWYPVTIKIVDSVPVLALGAGGNI